VPPDDSFWFDNEEDIGPAGPEATESGPEEPVASVQRRPWSLAFDYGDLLAESEDFQRSIGLWAEENTEGNKDSEEELEHDLTFVTCRNAGLVNGVEICASH
jgi:hypothetical protein